jgi:alpha-tubulin suppressor-like RCC1 family protein
LSVVLPLNTTAKTVFYGFTLSATGQTTKTKTVRVGVLPGAGRPALAGVKTVVGTPLGTLCALLDSGGVDCWGSNSGGSLGNGTITAPQTCPTGPCATTPHPVVGVDGAGTLSDVQQLATDDEGTFCARLGSGGVVCWGPEYFGELGDGSSTGPDACPPGTTLTCSPAPVVVVDASGPLNGVTDLKADTEQAFCALRSDGTVECWGFGGDSNTGNGTTNWDNPIAAPVIAVGTEGQGSPPPLTGVTALSTGGIGFCAILTTSDAVCWGFNRYGNLAMGAPGTAPDSCHGEGNGAGDCSAEPQIVLTKAGTALSGVTQMVPDGLYGWCAVRTSAGVDCWGDNSYAELGNGSAAGPVACLYGPCAPYAVPVVSTTGTGTLKGVRQVVSDEILSDPGNYPTMCAVLKSGGADCWGSNNYAQLGQGTTGDASPDPVAVPAPGSTMLLTGVRQITGNYQGFCADAAGRLNCWGQQAPVSPIANLAGNGALSGVSSVAGLGLESESGFCAIMTSGKLDCVFPSNDSGQLGNGTINQITPPAPTPTSPYNRPVTVLAPF